LSTTQPNINGTNVSNKKQNGFKCLDIIILTSLLELLMPDHYEVI
jgi:hypothetical protein